MQVNISLFSEKWQETFIRAGMFIRVNTVLEFTCFLPSFVEELYQNQHLQLCMARTAWSDSVIRSAKIG